MRPKVVRTLSAMPSGWEQREGWQGYTAARGPYTGHGVNRDLLKG